jgi:flagellar biosynthesis/type III secretory pathway M-ring protein FliF/YscJ
MICLWMLGRRTGVKRNRRWVVIGIGIAFMAVYIACGLMITPGEWEVLLPKLQAALSQ